MKKWQWILIVAVLILLIIFFYPKKITTCAGETMCYGYVKTNIERSTWLNVKDSVFEIKEEEIKSCTGYSVRVSFMMDACPGSWGWYNEYPISCEQIMDFCRIPSERVHNGIKCVEWNRMCEEIKNNDKVPISIENVSDTRIHII